MLAVSCHFGPCLCSLDCHIKNQSIVSIKEYITRRFGQVGIYNLALKPSALAISPGQYHGVARYKYAEESPMSSILKLVERSNGGLEKAKQTQAAKTYAALQTPPWNELCVIIS